MKKNLGRILAASAFALLIAALAFVYVTFGEKAVSGSKSVTLEVISSAAEKTIYTLKTDAEYLADALVGNGIVVDNQSAYGLYILTADGETADESKQEWWCITRGGESAMTGASDTPIADGDAYELTFMVGYDS